MIHYAICIILQERKQESEYYHRIIHPATVWFTVRLKV